MIDALNQMPHGAAVACAAIVGIIFGSFIATLVVRWPDGRSVLSGRSACDNCGQQLAARDLVPLLSALASRGRCRSCGKPIDAVHGLTELAGGLIGACALAILPGSTGWLWALFGWLLLPLALLDARHLWLPDRLVALLAVVGLLIAGPLLDTRILDRGIGAVVGGAAMGVIAWVYRMQRGADGMGGGDPKLVAALGTWLGWQALPLMLLLASAGGLLWAFASQGKRDLPLALRQVPFGSFAAIAAWAAVALWPLISAR